jgi:hypothetical protein
MSFPLSKEEFSLFSLQTRLDFTSRFGTFVGRRLLSAHYCACLYRLNDFYVEVLYDLRMERQVEVSLVVKNTLLKLYETRREYD